MSCNDHDRGGRPLSSHGQLVALRFSCAVQLWLVPVPPQSTVSVELEVSHVPVQPVRADVPSVIAALVNEPSMASMVVPSSALPAVELDVNVIVQAFCVMHSGAAASRSPQPWPLTVMMYEPAAFGHGPASGCLLLLLLPQAPMSKPATMNVRMRSLSTAASCGACDRWL